MIVLFVCAQRPVSVQFVLPVHTAVGFPSTTNTANLLWPMCELLLKKRLCIRLPMSLVSSSRMP
jgi:hypothetical protein